MNATPGPLCEYACREGNHAFARILPGQCETTANSMRGVTQR